MKSVVFAVLAVAGQAVAQNLSGEPPCATACLSSAISAAGCAADDVGCQCGPTQSAIATLVAPCLLASCAGSALFQAESAGLALCSQYSATAKPASASASATGSGSGSSSTTTGTVTGSASGSSATHSGNTAILTSVTGQTNGTTTTATTKTTGTAGTTSKTGSTTGGTGTGTGTSAGAGQSSTTSSGAAATLGAGVLAAFLGVVAAL